MFFCFTGLAKKEDYKYIQYYCPHCRTLNGTRPVEDGLSLTDEPAETSPKLELSKAIASVDGETLEISNPAAPALVSQLISGELDNSDSSEESN